MPRGAASTFGRSVRTSKGEQLLPDTAEASRSDLRMLFEQGAVYADRWTAEVRAALDVRDPLAGVVAAALADRKSVILAGNAGDGKSHLAQVALDQMSSRRCFEVTKQSPAPSPVPPDALLFIRDASSLSDEAVLEAVRSAHDVGAPLLMTINEGPLSSLAKMDDTGFFGRVREVLHGRAIGQTVHDQDDFLILNLAGRQLTRSSFVIGALERLLPVVTPCKTCGKSNKCPRVVGARLLKKSKRAQERLQGLLRLLSDGGQHISAREIWVFLIELFFGWTCPPSASEVEKARGYFWMRVFEGESRLALNISSEFDPITVPMAREDVYLWQGDFDKIRSDIDYPGSRPSVIARDSAQDGRLAFASAKRCFFFFGKDLNVESILARRSRAPIFGKILERAGNDSRPVIREMVGIINAYRLHHDTENDLWISRHHGFAAQRRPTGLGASDKVGIDGLKIRVPYSHEGEIYPNAGFFPTTIFLCWESSDQFLLIDFTTWERLKGKRTLTVDRRQETLDFALDLFLSQAPVVANADPEIRIYDHRRHESTTLRIRPEDRKIEVIS